MKIQIIPKDLVLSESNKTKIREIKRNLKKLDEIIKTLDQFRPYLNIQKQYNECIDTFSEFLNDIDNRSNNDYIYENNEEDVIYTSTVNAELMYRLSSSLFALYNYLNNIDPHNKYAQKLAPTVIYALQETFNDILALRNCNFDITYIFE